MAKLNSGAITKTEIKEYLNNYSDFSFELKVLKKLSDLGFDCRHSGVYEDPVTKKSREYDIRAEKELGFRKIRAAVECKNIRENYPLVAHCVRRPEQESFHDLIITHEEARSGSYSFPTVRYSSTRVRLRGEESLYAEGGSVAKSIDQVGKSSNGIVSSDGSVFEKVNQALHSAYDLIETAHHDREELEKKATLILPILVIPDSRLWAVNYDEDGALIGDIQLVDHVSLFVGQSWRVGHVSENFMASNFVWYKMSHLEIVSFSGIERLLELYFPQHAQWNPAFTEKEPKHLLTEEYEA